MVSGFCCTFKTELAPGQSYLPVGRVIDLLKIVEAHETEVSFVSDVALE